MIAAQHHVVTPSMPPEVAEWATAAVATTAAVAYLLGARRLRIRGDAWPVQRDAAFLVGALALVLVLIAPLPGPPFTAHMGQHVVAAMAAPLLLVLGRPITLALRALPPGRIRRGIVAAARSRLISLLLFPPLAALLDLGDFGCFIEHRW